jgi:hypothetical protein
VEAGVTSRRDLLRRATASLAPLGIVPADTPLAGEPTVSERRRRRGRAAPDAPRFLTLVEDAEGVVRWEGDAIRPRGGWRRPGPRRSGADGGRVVDELKYTPVYGSEVAGFLAGLDERLNPARGLYAVGPAGAPTKAEPRAGSRTLLIVHGTFSRGEALLSGLRAQAAGRAFLAEAQDRYDQVLSFEHATLSVSPLLNALDLHRAFRGRVPQALDVVSHSRGGLVVRFWLEALGGAQGAPTRAVFVGVPHLGTSLASPRRLRAGLDLLTNVAFALGTASGLAAGAVPLLGAVAGLLKLLGSVTALGTVTPVVDAAAALVPGLLAQARYGVDASEFLRGNFELQRLAEGVTDVPAGYSFVKCDFEPKDEGWRFWRAFMRPEERLADAGADRVFAGEGNDLVVNTASMDGLAPGVAASTGSVLDLGTSPAVHHLSYFLQEEVGRFLSDRLGEIRT